MKKHEVELSHLFAVLEQSPTIQAHFKDINNDISKVKVLPNSIFEILLPESLATFDRGTGSILIPTNLLNNPISAVYNLAHELRNLWQSRNGMLGLMLKSEIHGALYLQCFIEADANAFAMTVAGELKDGFSQGD